MNHNKKAVTFLIIIVFAFVTIQEYIVGDRGYLSPIHILVRKRSKER